jgi:hypothetical protein
MNSFKSFNFLNGVVPTSLSSYIVFLKVLIHVNIHDHFLSIVQLLFVHPHSPNSLGKLVGLFHISLTCI